MRILTSEALNKAASIRRAGHIDKAKKIYQAILDAIENQRKSGKFEVAIKNYQLFLAEEPNDIKACFGLAAAYHSKGQLNQAISEYNAILKTHPGSAVVHNNIGVIYLEKDKIDAALDAFDKALNCDSALSEAYNNRANSYLRQGLLESAMEGYTSALKSNEYYVDAFVNLFRLQMQLHFVSKNHVEKEKQQSAILEQKLVKQPKYQILKAIDFFIQGKLSLSKTYLSNYELLKKQKKIGILGRKDQKFCKNYSSFIKRLINQIEINPSASINNIYHIGESHCLSYAHSSLRVAKDQFVVRPLITLGAKAFHFAKEEPNQYKSITKTNLEMLPNKSLVLISFGEIDCRIDEGLISAARKNKNNLIKLVEKTVKDFLLWFVKQNMQWRHSLYFLNVPAPIYQHELTYESNQRVAKVIQLFNDALKQYLCEHPANLVDVYKYTKDDNGYSTGEFHLDRYHLKKRMIKNIEQEIQLLALSEN